ncbi:MAG: hypothetical protein QOD98_2431 [Nocardioidaceae bacterium]|jgi:hypothetical protein|nr:hypothetical protein [Nocardioidaceae bacterium]
MLIHPPRGRRLANRRVWALHVLRLHVEDGGICTFCDAKYGTAPQWPCVPARIALLYAGQPKI